MAAKLPFAPPSMRKHIETQKNRIPELAAQKNACRTNRKPQIVEIGRGYPSLLYSSRQKQKPPLSQGLWLRCLDVLQSASIQGVHPLLRPLGHLIARAGPT